MTWLSRLSLQARKTRQSHTLQKLEQTDISMNRPSQRSSQPFVAMATRSLGEHAFRLQNVRGTRKATLTLANAFNKMVTPAICLFGVSKTTLGPFRHVTCIITNEVRSTVQI